MSKILRIGTRDSQLALWQANKVKDLLQQQGYTSELVPIKSKGDLNTTTPLYELGIVGVFTNALDIALLNGEIDLAVHSMKDVPTLLPEGIVQTAVLPRGASIDIVAMKETVDFGGACTIATGSIRRKAQWLHRYPHHKVVGLRGNVNTRLQKLVDSDWQGAIFAKAGLERIDLLPNHYQELDWMIPAPAQGAMMIVALEKDTFTQEATSKLNDEGAQITTHVEREFLRTLEGGCTAPIGALAQLQGEEIQFKGALFSLDGTIRLEIDKSVSKNAAEGFGADCAHEILKNGGKAVMERIKNELQ